MSDENLNLNKNLLGGGGIYRKYVRIKGGGKPKRVRLRSRGEGRGLWVFWGFFGDFCAYV